MNRCPTLDREKAQSGTGRIGAVCKIGAVVVALSLAAGAVQAADKPVPMGHDQLEPENIAAVSNYVRSAAGVVGATDLIELKASPEFAPLGTFVEVCDSDTQAIYDAIWKRLKR